WTLSARTCTSTPWARRALCKECFCNSAPPGSGAGGLMGRIDRTFIDIHPDYFARTTRHTESAICLHQTGAIVQAIVQLVRAANGDFIRRLAAGFSCHGIDMRPPASVPPSPTAPRLSHRTSNG